MDSSKSNAESNEDKKANKKVKVSFELGLKNVLVTLVTILVLLLTFYLGWHFGYRSQVNKYANSPFENPNSTAYVKHRALVGSITKVSSSQIVVSLDNKQTQAASLNSSTIIRNTKGQTISASTLQVGNKVIVTAEVESNNSLLATNILVIS